MNEMVTFEVIIVLYMVGTRRSFRPMSEETFALFGLA